MNLQRLLITPSHQKVLPSLSFDKLPGIQLLQQSHTSKVIKKLSLLSATYTVQVYKFC